MTCQSDIAQTQETPLMRGGLICCVNSRSWRPKKCTDSQREHSQPEQKYAKISQNISKEFMSHILQKWTRSINIWSTSWLFSNISNVQIPHFKEICFKGQFFLRGFQPPGLGFLDTAFKRRRPRWKRAKSGSWKVYPPSQNQLDPKPSMSWMNCLIHPW